MTFKEKAAQLTAHLKEVEDELFRQGLLVEAEVPISEDGRLRWAKKGQDWFLFFVDKADTAHRLDSTSLGRRMSAVQHLEPLLQAIYNADAERSMALDLAVESIANFVHYLQELSAATEAPSPTGGEERDG